MPRLSRAERGFTLLEVAIVLVIFALLVSGILAGNSLVQQARIKYTAVAFTGLEAAYLNYVDRYGAVPGDDPRVTNRWTNSKNGTGDGVISGSYAAPPPPGDPMTALTVNAADGESLNFWWHMRRSELIDAPPVGISIVAQPLNPYGGVIGVENASFGFPQTTFCQANVPGDTAVGVESQIDEGSPIAGRMRGRLQTAPNQATGAATPVTTYDATAGQQYLLCFRVL